MEVKVTQSVSCFKVKDTVILKFLTCHIKISPFHHLQNIFINLLFEKTRALWLQLFCWRHQHKEIHLIMKINCN